MHLRNDGGAKKVKCKFCLSLSTVIRAAQSGWRLDNDAIGSVVLSNNTSDAQVLSTRIRLYLERL